MLNKITRQDAVSLYLECSQYLNDTFGVYGIEVEETFRSLVWHSVHQAKTKLIHPSPSLFWQLVIELVQMEFELLVLRIEEAEEKRMGMIM